MNSQRKTAWLAVLTTLALFLTTFQPIIPTIPGITESGINIVGAVVFYVLSLTTIWKQYINDDIANMATKVTIWIAIAATITGALDLFNVFSLSTLTAQWIRFIFTFAVMFINIASKAMFPSDELKMNRPPNK